MSRENVSYIVATEAHDACIGVESFDDRIRAAMKSASNSWITTDDNERFLGAVAGILMSSKNDEETERIKAELEFLNGLSTGRLGEIPQILIDKPIGLVKIWKDVTEQ